MKNESLVFRRRVGAFFAACIGFLCFCLQSNAEVVDVDNADLQRLINSGIPILDIRTEPEWKETGIVPRSIGLTFFDEKGDYNIDEWMGSLTQIVEIRDPIILICRSGRRTKIVANYLSDRKNYKTVYNVQNGIKGWISEGLPVNSYN